MDLDNWDYAKSSRGDRYVTREIGKTKMSKYAIGKLEEGMSRLEKGTAKPSEYGKVRGQIYELRVNQDKRWYRLLYARVKGKYVALLLGAKKTNQLDMSWADTAEERLGEYRTTPP